MKGEKLFVKYRISQYVCIDSLSNIHSCFIIVIDAIEIHTSVQEVVKSEHWTQAIREEMDDALERTECRHS